MTRKLKSFLFCIVFLVLMHINIVSQTEYVRTDNPVYRFLERMEALRLIEQYNSFEIPKPRKEIGEYLKELIKKENELDNSDINILEDLKVEFELEISGSLNDSQSLIGKGTYELFSEKEKYLFYHDDPGIGNLFINLISEGEVIFSKNENSNSNSSAALGLIGGEIRGSLMNNFGFFIRGYQGKVSGNVEAARLRKEIEYNYKFNLEPDEAFFDETEGYVTADFDLVKFKLGRDRLNTGFGNIRPLINDNAPEMDYLSFNIDYLFLNFSYFHGKLLGERSSISDISGNDNIVKEKYLGYHRLSFNLSPAFNFGAGEFIVYGDRPPDFSYLNPFSFYKSAEHSNQDRDNSMLFFDLNSKVIKGTKIFALLLLDDISFGKIGTGWWGNQAMLHAGVNLFNFYRIIPIDFSLEYLRIEPYTYSHRFQRNNFTHNGYSLNGLQPNSELFFSQINYRFNHRLEFSAGFSYLLHGANPLNPDGSVKENVGGDILLGHRIFDSEKVDFLAGEKEYSRTYFLTGTFEPVNRFIFLLKIIYRNNTLQRQFSQKELQSFITFKVKI